MRSEKRSTKSSGFLVAVWWAIASNPSRQGRPEQWSNPSGDVSTYVLA
jgi:hypothetical protein